jgi:hypothetical protein
VLSTRSQFADLLFEESSIIFVRINYLVQI